MALIALIYWPALHGGFIFDDYPIFAENPAIQVTGWSFSEWQGVWSWSQSNIQRPLAMLSYAFNFALGNGVFGFKVTNLCIHLLNTLLVWLFTRQVLRVAYCKVPGSAQTGGSSSADLWALGITALWAAHPLQLSAVMYVVQRMELLGFTFTLLALLCYWHARCAQREDRRSWPWLVLSILIVIAGWGAKETIVLVPGYALLLELTVLRFAAARPRVTRLWRLFFTAGCVIACIGFVAYLLPHYANTSAFSGRDFTASERELTQLRVLPMYIGWAVLPLPSHLLFYYDNYLASTGLTQPLTTLYGGIFLVALLLLAIFLRRRRPLIALGIGWFFMAHVLTSSPLALELAFEHRNYPALLGIAWALVDGVRWLAQRTKSVVPITLGIVLILNLCFLTTLRSLTWASPALLAQNLATENPGSQRAAMDLARRLMAMSGGNADSPLYSLCIQELERAARLPEDAPLPEEALLLISAQHPERPSKPWWDSLDEKLRERPLMPDTFQVLHALTRQRLQGNTGIDETRLAQAYEIVVARAPNRQTLQADYAELAGAVLGHPKLALVHWGKTLELDSDPATYGMRLAGYLVDQKRYQEAAGVIEKTWLLAPGSHDNRTLSALMETATRSMHPDDAALKSAPSAG